MNNPESYDKNDSLQPSDPTTQWDFNFPKLITQNQNQYIPQEDEDASFEQADSQPVISQERQKRANEIKNMPWTYPSTFALCHFIFSLFSLAMIIPTSFDKFYYNFKDKSTPGVFQYMSANLKTDPIMDIQILDQHSSCPSGFELLTLSTWPGTVAGCLCYNEGLLGKTCQQANSSQCQIDIPGTSPINIYKWRGSIWCVKRAVLGTDYLKKTVCPEGYKECYPGACFIKDCPITRVKISSTGTANKLSKVGPDGKERFLEFTKSRGMPLIDFDITPNAIPCFDQNAFTATRDSFIYPLLKGAKRDSCGDYGLDSHLSIMLDSQNSSELYLENSFPQSIVDLPHFQMNANKAQSVLSWRVKMGTARNDQCFEINPEYTNLSAQTVDSSREKIKFIESLVAACYGLTLVLFAFNLFFYSNFGLKLCALDFLSLSRLSSFSISVLCVIQFAIINDLHKAAKITSEYLGEYNSLECFEGEQVDLAINNHIKIFDHLDICYSESLLFLVYNSILIALWISYFIRKLLSKCNTKKIDG